MATQKINLTRDQLATFLKNHEQIKQFERLFQVVDEVSPSSDTTGISIQAGNADATANEALALVVRLTQDAAINSGAADQKAVQALDTLGRIANALEMLATAPVIQNNNSVVTDYIDLPEDGPHVTQARRVQWNQDDGTLDVGLYGGSVLQVGQELMYYAKNTSGGLITNGTPVMFTGTVGSSGKLTFGLAVADGSVLADYMIGVTTQDIADNAFGYVTSFGLVRGFNTTGSPYGETWVDGDLLYFDPATPGTWTNIKPVAPAIDVPVAVVINAGSGGSGSIFVRMTVAEALSRLQDVYINGTGTPLAGQVLIYDATQQRWENHHLTAGTNVSIVNGDGSITINATDAFTGTVTSVAALTLGTTGTDLSSTVANPTTTPVITLNVPTASATNRGALSPSDWSTFNSKEPAITPGTTAQYWSGDKTWQDFATSVRSAVLTGLSTATNAVITAADTVLSAFGKLQAQITAHVGASSSVHGVTGNVVGTSDSQALTNKTISGSNNTLSNIGNSSLTNSSVTVNGVSVSLGSSATVTAVNPNSLTLGSYLTGGTYNGSAAITAAVDATSTNTASKVVARDASGNFAAGNVTFNSVTSIQAVSSGYGTGAGGSVTQTTNKSTSVTLNKPCGRIIMNNAALAGGASVTFYFLNSTVSNYDVVNVNVWSNPNYEAKVVTSYAGIVYIEVKNRTAGSLSDAVALNFTVTKGVDS
jgi:hypothetical protein